MDRRVASPEWAAYADWATDTTSIWKWMREGRSAIGPLLNTELHGLKGIVGAEIKALPDHNIDPSSSYRWIALAVPCRDCSARKPCARPAFLQ